MKKWLIPLLVFAALPSFAEEQPAELRFDRPRFGQLILGETRIELSVDLPAGIRVERIEVRANGEPLDTITEAPWITTFDAGEEGVAHRFAATAFLSNGRTIRASTRTQPSRFKTFERVELVNLFAIVKKGGDYVRDLTKDEFVVLEDGRPQTISRFSAEREPLKVAIVMDTSLSMIMEQDRIGPARKAAKAFLEALDPGDEAMLVSFNDEVTVLEQLTDDRNVVAQGIDALQPIGGTALYDAVWRSAKHLGRSGAEGRRVLVVLSDGRDEATSGLEPGSLHTLREALDRALRDDVMVFAVGIGRDLDKMDFHNRQTRREILTTLAETTGGRVFFPNRLGGLRKTFENIAEELRHQYSLAYSSDSSSRDGKWRWIEVRTTKPNLEVVTRKGYYAPEGNTGD